MTAHVHPHPHSYDGRSHAETVDPEIAQLGPADHGTVVMDIGGDFGSLIIMAPEALAGAEIEISPVGSDDVRMHIAIRERRAPGGTRWAGVFPPLRVGSYTIWNLDGTPHETITVLSGEVTQTDWR